MTDTLDKLSRARDALNQQFSPSQRPALVDYIDAKVRAMLAREDITLANAMLLERDKARRERDEAVRLRDNFVESGSKMAVRAEYLEDKLERVERERDEWKARAETAEKALQA